MKSRSAVLSCLVIAIAFSDNVVAASSRKLPTAKISFSPIVQGRDATEKLLDHIVKRGNTVGFAPTFASPGIASAEQQNSSSVTGLGSGDVTEQEILEVQDKWAAAIVNISDIYFSGGNIVDAAAEAAADLYAYGHGNVLFKPTRAYEEQFRPTPEGALSYFVGYKHVGEDGYPEDDGFAINGGNGWSSCVYKNHKIELIGGIGMAMGNYFFTDATTGELSMVEYTFGYKRTSDGKVRIFLHHSSAPFVPGEISPLKQYPYHVEVNATATSFTATSPQ